MRQFSYLNTSIKILEAYNGGLPFSLFVKDFFRLNKKYGSRDRKAIIHLCFCYFRLGKSLAMLLMEKRVIAGLFLCSSQPNDLLEVLNKEWNQQTSLSVGDKFQLIGESSDVDDIFPFTSPLSTGLNKAELAVSHLIQPDLFIRIRPGHRSLVFQKLTDHLIAFDEINSSCLSVGNTTKLQDVLAINKEVVIQDRSSQSIGKFMRRETDDMDVWDCCCASGGKSIMAVDMMGNIKLSVSDIRPSILVNLKSRFREAGIVNYKSFVADIGTSSVKPPASHFDLIIADVPCTGSGTWSRTPEQLYYFDESKITGYQRLQLSIVTNVLPSLKAGGCLLYSTCSVFAAENEEVVNELVQQYPLEIMAKESFVGYDKKADTLFACLMRKR